MPFYDHMLLSLAKHSLIDLTVRGDGDTHVDAHHTVEDVAIVLGEALREALGDKSGISRFGDATVPLDEALVQAVVDVAGRPYVVHEGEPAGQQYVLIGGHYVGSLTRHVLESFAFHAQIALHVRVLSGRDPHHVVEAQFKAARARPARRRRPGPPRRRHPERQGRALAVAADRAPEPGTASCSCAGRPPPSTRWVRRGLVRRPRRPVQGRGRASASPRSAPAAPRPTTWGSRCSPPGRPRGAPGRPSGSSTSHGCAALTVQPPRIAARAATGSCGSRARGRRTPASPAAAAVLLAAAVRRGGSREEAARRGPALRAAGEPVDLLVTVLGPARPPRPRTCSCGGDCDGAQRGRAVAARRAGLRPARGRGGRPPRGGRAPPAPRDAGARVRHPSSSSTTAAATSTAPCGPSSTSAPTSSSPPTASARWTPTACSCPASATSTRAWRGLRPPTARGIIDSASPAVARCSGSASACR